MGREVFTRGRGAKGSRRLSHPDGPPTLPARVGRLLHTCRPWIHVRGIGGYVSAVLGSLDICSARSTVESGGAMRWLRKFCRACRLSPKADLRAPGSVTTLEAKSALSGIGVDKAQQKNLMLRRAVTNCRRSGRAAQQRVTWCRIGRLGEESGSWIGGKSDFLSRSGR